MPSLRSAVALLSLAAAVGACTGIRVRPVTYRLKGLVAGPLNRGTVSDGRARFAEVFCATLQHINNSGGQWGACENYLEIDQPVTLAALADLPPVRILLVAGVFSECLAPDGVTMFKDAARHLMDPYYHQGIEVEHLAVPAL
jgi:hypothetical protein